MLVFSLPGPRSEMQKTLSMAHHNENDGTTFLPDSGDRRKAERDSMQRLVEIRWKQDGEERQATALLQNFSLSGLYLLLSNKLQDNLKPETHVSCTLLVPEDIPSIGGMPWLCEGRVNRVNQPQEDPGSIGVGIKFSYIHFLEWPESFQQKKKTE